MSATILGPTPRDASPATASARAHWTGRVLSAIAIIFLTFDVGTKLIGARPAVEGTMQLGFPAHLVTTIGIIGAVCLVLYVIPRTAPLGAILWTGYLGGAVAAQLRLENPLFSHILFPIYIAAFLWGGLYLRDERVRALLRPAR